MATVVSSRALDNTSDAVTSVVFVLNLSAVIPLAWLLGVVTEELALRTNETIGGAVCNVFLQF